LEIRKDNAMTFNKEKLEAVANEAKAKTDSKRWQNAIDKAVAGLLGGWIVTELQHCVAITTESGKTYRANGVCQCEAFFKDQPCKHRAAARLITLYNEKTAPEAVSRDSRTVEFDRTGVKYTVVRTRDGWCV
jgi:hypothetical protein